MFQVQHQSNSCTVGRKCCKWEHHYFNCGLRNQFMPTVQEITAQSDSPTENKSKEIAPIHVQKKKSLFNLQRNL